MRMRRRTEAATEAQPPHWTNGAMRTLITAVFAAMLVAPAQARTPDKEIFKPTKDTAPGQKVDYVVPSLKAGTYYFQCDIHASMNGTVTVK